MKARKSTSDRPLAPCAGEGADLAVVVAVTHAVMKLPQLFDPVRLPGLAAHRQACEALPAFTAAAYSAAEASATGWRPET